MCVKTTVFERERPETWAVHESLENSEWDVFWLANSPDQRRAQLIGSHQTDLLIVGGGYTGLWTALRAKERDPSRKVTLVEANTLGWAASGRNGGFCESSLTHGYDNGLSRWPADMPLLERLGHENLQGIVDTIQRYDMDVDLEETGVMQLALEDHQVPWLEEKKRTQRRIFLAEQNVRDEVNSPIIKAGYWDKDENILVDPAKLVQELARVATDAGVEIFVHTPIRRLHQGTQGMLAESDQGQIQAKNIVLGTNVFPSLLRRNRLMTVPVYDYVLATEPLTTEQLESIGWQNRQGLSDLANQFHYSRLTADNRIIYGGYDAVYYPGRAIRSGYEDRTETFQKLASHFFTTFPQLKGLKFTHRWGGVIDTSTRFCAFFGTAYRNRVAYAAGYTGLGVAATRYAADVMLDMLADQRTDRTENAMVRSRPMPFPPEPAATIGIQTTRWALDRADHNLGQRNLFLRTLDRMGLGFDS